VCPEERNGRFPIRANTSHTKCIAVDPRNPSVLHVAVEQGGLFRSDDSGASWRELDSYYRSSDRWYRDIHRIVATRDQSRPLLHDERDGALCEQRYGRDMGYLTDPEYRIGYPDHLVVSPEDARVLFMSGAQHDPTEWHVSHYANGTVMQSRDGGGSWIAFDSGLPERRRANIEAMCIASYPGGFSSSSAIPMAKSSNVRMAKVSGRALPTGSGDLEARSFPPRRGRSNHCDKKAIIKGREASWRPCASIPKS